MTETIAALFAEQTAANFLTTTPTNGGFIGADIERLLAERATVIYRDVADTSYYGALIQLKQQNFAILNTAPPLRQRYYHAAHTLWDLVATSYQQNVTASDAFTAAIMLPARQTTVTWQRLQRKADSPAFALLQLADQTAMPYHVVAHRLADLQLLAIDDLLSRTEAEWLAWRTAHHPFPSALDRPLHMVHFDRLTTDVMRYLDHDQLTTSDAAQLLRNANPDLAQRYSTHRSRSN
ncbi:hypothetical protein [Levilactobacillus enshiensis]|uniref:hypothetical protein n=1 Tax=Levilactobacillus enshiensis TaxID=2590213 RepID=UPI00117A1CEF|nr:hypothetical protein [Levilactobacillus enshiensis]